MNTMYFSNCRSLDDVERTYKEIYAMFGLQGQPADHFIRKAVDEQYGSISKAFASMEQPGSTTKNELTL